MDASFASLIKEGVKTGMLNARVSYPAIVESFDNKEQTVKAFIAIKQIINGENVALPILVDVPVVIQTVNGFHMTLPIKKGDEIVVIFSDRCFDTWFEKGGVQHQSEHRVHHISDGMAIVGINSKPNVIKDYDPDNLVIRNTANNQKMTFKVNGDIDVQTTANVNIKCKDMTINTTANLTANVSGSAKLTAPTTEVNSTVTINGDTTMNGNLNVSGSITSGTSVSAPVVSGVTSLTVGGVEMGGHVHGGVASGTDTTAPVG